MNKKRCLVVTVIAVVAALFLASSCTTSANNQPIIASLEPEAEQVAPLGSLQVVCTASDPDGDELSYQWSASAGQVSGDGYTATWTAPASEGSYGVTVVVTDGHGGEATDYAVIAVRANNPPTIGSLTADAEWTIPSGTVQVTCSASDPDDDELGYEWTANGGDISGTGAVVNWIAPQELGTYNITVVVKDGYGSSAMDSVTISALTGQPPTIEGLIITADHCYLKPYSGGYYVGKEQMYHIECSVADTSIEVFYEWSCTGGDFSGEGSLVTWTAPATSGYVTVTVTASDVAGHMAGSDITLNAVSCSPCTFGC